MSKKSGSSQPNPKYSLVDLAHMAVEANKIIDKAQEPDETIKFIAELTLVHFVSLLETEVRQEPKPMTFAATKLTHAELDRTNVETEAWQRKCAKATVLSALSLAEQVLAFKRAQSRKAWGGGMTRRQAVAQMNANIRERIKAREEHELAMFERPEGHRSNEWSVARSKQRYSKTKRREQPYKRQPKHIVPLSMVS